MMDKATAEKLIKFITTRMERESGLLNLTPDTVIGEAYKVLDLIKAEAGIPDETVDHWMLVAQAQAPAHNKDDCIFCQTSGVVIKDIKVEWE